MEHPYFDSGADEFAEQDLEMEASVKRGGILMYVDNLLSVATQQDLTHAGHKTLASRKVVYLSSEIGADFCRLKLLPSVSDKAFEDDPNEQGINFVKMPNNVLFGTREIYAFAPESNSSDLRDPELLISKLVFVILYGESGEQEIYAISEDQIVQVEDLTQARELASVMKAGALLPETNVRDDVMSRVYLTVINSRIVDQDNREPLAE